jgi:light-regulated signal transduction histidine kinase (bacteriophytochrome)
MTRGPTFDQIFATMSAASVGDTGARVALPEDPTLEDTATRFAIALNLLLDDLAFQTAEAEAAHRITETDLERMVAERTLELQNVNQELEAFSYSVAHDLRAPLRSIDGFGQALLEDYGDRLDADGKKYLANVRESAQRMALLIDDLLKLSRVVRSEFRRDPVDLARLATSVLSQLEKTAPERMVEQVIGDALIASGDAALLRVLLENLLGNAWKFTAKRPAARIELGARDEEGRRVFFVRDNGAGFDMKYADKLFAAFQRLHTSAEFEGTGIGLAIVQRIVRRHGGRVWAEGELGRGATFFFTLDEEA